MKDENEAPTNSSVQFLSATAQMELSLRMRRRTLTELDRVNLPDFNVNLLRVANRVLKAPENPKACTHSPAS